MSTQEPGELYIVGILCPRNTVVSLLSEVGQKKWTMYKLGLLTPGLESLAALSFLSPDGAVRVSVTPVAWPRELPVTTVGLADS